MRVDHLTLGKTVHIAINLGGSFSAGSADALDGQGGGAGFLGDKPVLFLDYGARGSITIDATNDLV